jgi:hypothetical protein
VYCQLGLGLEYAYCVWSVHKHLSSYRRWWLPVSTSCWFPISLHDMTSFTNSGTRSARSLDSQVVNAWCSLPVPWILSPKP